MNIDLWPAVAVSAIPLAGLLALVGLAWVVVFRTTKILNFATGEFAILGTYLYYTYSQMHWPLLLAGLAAFVTMGVISAVLYLATLRPLAGREHWVPIIATMGIALILDSVMSIRWGVENITLPVPYSGPAVNLGAGASLNYSQIAIICLAVVTFPAVVFFLHRTRTGRWTRAAAEHPLLAGQGGININVVFAIGWGLSAGLATIAGIGYGMTTVLVPSAISIGQLGLAPAILGGLDSVGGVVIGAVVAAFVTSFVTLYLGANSVDAVSGLLLLVAITIKPTGLFGTRDVQRV